jgi:hypothetical protein
VGCHRDADVLGVELLLHRLHLDGLAPRIVTYQGGNMDIWIGLSAPLIAWSRTLIRECQSLESHAIFMLRDELGPRQATLLELA